MGRNTGKRHSSQDQDDKGLKTSKDHAASGSDNRAKGGDNQSERERNAGKEGGARAGKSRRTGSASNEE